VNGFGLSRFDRDFTPGLKVCGAWADDKKRLEGEAPAEPADFWQYWVLRTLPIAQTAAWLPSKRFNIGELLFDQQR